MDITKETINQLVNGELAHKQHNTIVGEINKKVDEIWRFIVAECCCELDWWAFDNDVYDGEGNGSDGGYFDARTDSEFIRIDYQISKSPSHLEPFEEGFPTSFLWEDYRPIVRKAIKNAEDLKAKKKIAQKAAQKVAKAKKAELIASIKEKLTKEELKVITFKK